MYAHNWWRRKDLSTKELSDLRSGALTSFLPSLTCLRPHIITWLCIYCELIECEIYEVRLGSLDHLQHGRFQNVHHK